MKKPIVLYDGDCKFCTISKDIAEKRTEEKYRYVSIHDDEGKALLEKHSLDGMRSSYLVDGDVVEEKSDAIMTIMKRMGPLWRTLAYLGYVLPKPIRNFLYDIVAKHRR